MPRRHHDHTCEEPLQKKSFVIPEDSRIYISVGEILTDNCGKEWKLGKPIGLGGFGVIHEICEANSNKNDQYVVKIEDHSSGPLFTEINCYLRIAKKKTIQEWKTQKNLSSLGMPNYVASGSHVSKNNKYRFLVIPRYHQDLELILQQKKKFNLKTVLLISSQILHILEYIHYKGYIHSDIKAANIMLGKVKVKPKTTAECGKFLKYSKSPVLEYKARLRACRAKKLRAQKQPQKRYDTRQVKYINYDENVYEDVYFDEFGETVLLSNYEEGKEESEDDRETQKDQLYLLDFGLASKYKLSSGEHKNVEDQRKAHAGTLLFCSRDAHRGLQSRRSDLESLAYNMVYWLTASLPWINDLESPEMVQRKKRHCFADPLGFLYFCMPDPPRILKEFFQYIKNLNMQDTPDYNGCQQFIRKSLRDHGYKSEDEFDFDNSEGWGIAKKNIPKKLTIPVDEFSRPPLLSNIPKLREKTKTKKKAVALKWSRMLSDPEILLKRNRERKTQESNELPTPLLDFKLEEMNPTPAMREVLHRYEERKGLSPNSSEDYDLSNIPEGYTPAMAAVYQKVLEQRALEEIVEPIKKKRSYKKVSKKPNSLPKESSRLKPKINHVTRSHSLRG